MNDQEPDDDSKITIVIAFFMGLFCLLYAIFADLPS